MSIFRKLLSLRLKFTNLKTRDKAVLVTSAILVTVTLLLVLQEETRLNHVNGDDSSRSSILNGYGVDTNGQIFQKRHLQKTANASLENGGKVNNLGHALGGQSAGGSHRGEAGVPQGAPANPDQEIGGGGSATDFLEGNAPSGGDPRALSLGGAQAQPPSNSPQEPIDRFEDLVEVVAQEEEEETEDSLEPDPGGSPGGAGGA